MRSQPPPEGSQEDIESLRKAKRVPVVNDVLNILEFFHQNAIPVWLHGGWAVEALLGEAITHQDVDLVMAAKDFERLRKVAGRRLVTHSGGVWICNFDLVQVDIIQYESFRLGYVSVTLRDLIWIMPDPSDASFTATLNGVEVPLVSPAFILAEQEHTVRKKKRVLTKMQERAMLLKAVLPEAIVRESRRYWPYRRNVFNELRKRLRML